MDARDSARKLFHSELVIPVCAGPLTLVYPRWGIPTYSLPAAAVNNIVRLKMTGNGRALEWKRDPIDMFSFHVVIPDDINIRMSLRSFSDDASRLSRGYLVPHEYVHSWNGTFRVPDGSIRRDYQQPQNTELHWVYEGLTRYLNWVLAARSGIFTTEEARDYVALLAAQQANRPGREWRSLQDTAVSAGILNDAADQWQSESRGSDYYDESLFIWLEVDTIIRRAEIAEPLATSRSRSLF